MSERFQQDPRRGQMPLASDLARVYRDVSAHAPERHSAGYGEFFSLDDAFSPIQGATPQLGFWARLTGAPGGPSNNAYPFVAAIEGSYSQSFGMTTIFTDDPSAPSSDTVTVPAFEVNGSTTDYTAGGTVNVYVWMWLSRTGSNFYFAGPVPKGLASCVSLLGAGVGGIVGNPPTVTHTYVWTTVLIDTAHYFDGNHNTQITIPSKGYYEIAFAGDFGTANVGAPRSVLTSVYVNNIANLILSVDLLDIQPSVITLNNSLILSLNAGDTIQVVTSCPAAGATFVNVTNPRLRANFLGS